MMIEIYILYTLIFILNLQLKSILTGRKDKILKQVRLFLNENKALEF